MNKALLYKGQREWRRHVISRLKHVLGSYCHGCESPDAAQLEGRPFLELVIPNRRGADLAKYGNNTITIYNAILKGIIPKDRVRLLCDDCKFKFRLEQDETKA